MVGVEVDFRGIRTKVQEDLEVVLVVEEEFHSWGSLTC